MTRISRTVLKACQVEVTGENEKCECFNWLQDRRLTHLNFSCVMMSSGSKLVVWPLPLINR